MAINLWKAGGKPTAYNPLPMGLTTSIQFNQGDYLINIKARSVSSATLKLDFSAVSVKWLDTGVVSTRNVPLTQESKVYSFSFNNPRFQSIYIMDLNNNGDIIIDSIELVQKPLPKFTINGIDGFNSGKWTLHANAKVLDDETCELNATASNQFSTIDIEISANQTYSFSRGNTNGRFWGFWLDSTKTAIGSSFNIVVEGEQGKTITSPLNTRYLRVNVDNQTTIGKFTFKRPMLNLGSNVAPYSKKTGEKMVLPVAKKNLIQSIEQGGSDGSFNLLTSTNRVRTQTISILSNKNYVISSIESNKQCYVWYKKIDGTYSVNGSGSWANLPFTFNYPDVKELKIVFKKADDSNILPSDITPMLEEGTIPTTYTPYEIQLNKKPKRKIVTKRVIASKRNLEARR